MTATSEIWQRHQDDYVELRTARGPGLSDRAVINRHNASGTLSLEVESIIGPRNRRRAVMILTTEQAQDMRTFLNKILGDDG